MNQLTKHVLKLVNVQCTWANEPTRMIQRWIYEQRTWYFWTTIQQFHQKMEWSKICLLGKSENVLSNTRIAQEPWQRDVLFCSLTCSDPSDELIKCGSRTWKNNACSWITAFNKYRKWTVKFGNVVWSSYQDIFNWFFTFNIGSTLFNCFSSSINVYST